MSTKNCDREIVIAGQGIAAIACALRLIQLGFRPALLSSAVRVTPGAEVIPGPVLPLIAELDLGGALARARAEKTEGFENRFDAGRPVLLPGRWIHFERRTFLRYALRQALARGVTWRLVGDIDSELRRQHSGAIVVDATGRSAILSRPLEQQGHEVASVFRTPGRAVPRARVFRSGEHWIYAIPFREQTTIGIVGPPVAAIPLPIADELAVRSDAARIARRPAWAQRSVQPVGPDRIAIGDAALAYNPLAGHGIRFAIQSSFAAAAVIRTWCDGSPQTAVPQQYYQEFVRGAWFRHTAFLNAVQAGETSSPPCIIPSKLQFRAVTREAGIQKDGQIAAAEVIELPDGGLVRWAGGIDLLELRSVAPVPVESLELIARICSRGISVERAHQLVEWCIRHGVLG